MFKKILVTGSSGFLGHHVLPQIQQAFEAEIFAPAHAQYDLLHAEATMEMFRVFQPDCVVHLAGKSGGIVDNKARPADYFHQNMLMNLHVFEAARQWQVKKLVSFMGGCSYPANAPSPIKETQMWDGFPQIESAGYSVAKKTLLVQAWAYRRQYNLNAIVLIPGNLYGEWDNFNLTQAHVIPALIRKFVEAGERGDETVTVLGTGRPTRDFVYAGDVAALIPWFMAHYNEVEPVNISTGKRTSIKDLVEMIKAATGFAGQVRWDTEKPDGQMDKIFDVTRLHALGLACNTELADGLARTVQWFATARQKGIARL